ncbi:MAG: hypothetical protein AA931_00655 [Peptococcaceae bacterium 1109]|nr:MAG: hypothetical protein AA931_00655 [Peptococcaceae bacterium 1109]
MYVLGIDTSTMTGGAAVVEDGKLIGEYVLNIRTTHSERLLPAIERLLNDSCLTLHDMEGIAVVTGPGSFTGIRIGVATAKGFAYALQKKLVGVTTLEAFARQFRSFPGIVVPMIDSRRSEVYAQAFQEGEAIGEPWNEHIDKVLEWCRLQGQPCMIVGDGALAYQEKIEQGLPEAVIPPPEFALLRPAAVAGLGWAKLQAGEGRDPFAVNPVYLRKTEAEIKWMEKSN